MLKDITLGQYFPGNSLAHRLDPRTKILLTVVYIVMLFCAKSFVSYGVVAALLIAEVKISGVAPKALVRGLKPILFIICFTAVLNLFYTPGETLVSFWIFKITKEGIFTAFFMALRISLLIMGTFSLVAVNLNHMFRELEDENQFLAYVDENYDDQSARALQPRLEGISNVASVTFVSRSEAMANFKETLEGRQDLFRDAPDSVLRDRFIIHVVDIEAMSETVEQVTGIADIQASLEVADGFLMIRNVAGGVAIILVAMLVLVSVFIISNTIKIATFTRREEIAVLRMCGASNWFIRWPFLVEGVLLGLVGAVLAYLAEWGIYGLIQRAMENSGILSIITTVPFSQLAYIVMLVFLVVGFAIGAGGSALAIRKFLKV